MKKKLLFLSIFLVSFLHILTQSPLRAPRPASPSKFSSDAVVGKNNNNLNQLSPFCASLKKQINNFQNITCDKFQQTWTILENIENALGCERVILQKDIPFVITEPGRYCLGETIFFNEGIAIDIQSNEVELNLQDFLISGMDSGLICIRARDIVSFSIKSGIVQNAQGIVLENCIGFKLDNLVCPRNRDWGLRLTNCRGFQVVNTTVNGTISLLPLSPFSGSGFILEQCSTVLLNNILTRGCAKNGILIIDSQDFILNELLIDICSLSGLVCDDTNDVHIINSESSTNGEYGFLFTASLGITNTTLADFFVEDCLANTNGKSGFALIDPPAGGIVEDLVFQFCEAGSNLEHGFEITGTNIVVRECSLVGNTMSGINVDGFATQLLNNAINGSGTNGIFLSLSAFNAQVINNKVNQSGIGINDASGGTNNHKIFNNFATNSTVMNYSAGVPFVRDPFVPDPIFGDSRDFVVNISG